MIPHIPEMKSAQFERLGRAQHWLIFLPLFACGFVLEAATNNPSTDWFQRAGYGVFVHYLEDLQNDPQQVHSLGRKTSWDECVREFDARRFADAMAEVGAGYVIFTVRKVGHPRPGAQGGKRQPHHRLQPRRAGPGAALLAARRLHVRGTEPVPRPAGLPLDRWRAVAHSVMKLTCWNRTRCAASR